MRLSGFAGFKAATARKPPGIERENGYLQFPWHFQDERKVTQGNVTYGKSCRVFTVNTNGFLDLFPSFFYLLLSIFPELHC